MFEVSFAVSLALVCVLERLLNAFLMLFSGEEDKGGHTHGVVTGCINMFLTLLMAAVNVLLRIVAYASSCVVWFIIIFCVLSVLYVSYEQFPGVWIASVAYYNARIGPFVHDYITLPLQFLNLLYKGAVPLWNGAIWLQRAVTWQGLMPLLWDQLATLVDLGVSLLQLGQHCSRSLKAYWQSLDCSDGSCLTTTVQLDLITPLSDVRIMALLSGKLGAAVCQAISTMVELALYPLTDLNLAQAVHNLVNAALELFIEIPITTQQRCAMYGRAGTAFDTMMCTPDLQPFFVNVVAGVTDLGQTLDDWLNVAYSVAVASLTGVQPNCSVPVALGPDSFRGGVLIGETAIVGLTDWLMASTNATLAFFYGGTLGSGATARTWPDVIDPTMGVAAVTFSEADGVDTSKVSQGQRPGARITTTLLGCRCVPPLSLPRSP